MNLSLKEQRHSIIQKFKESNCFNIIFICSGNIIRSPYAHLLFEHLIKDDEELMKKIQVKSGGVRFRNYSISTETRNRLLKDGISSEDIARFKPRYHPDYPDMFQKVDLILVMEKSHIPRVPRHFKEITFLLLEFTLELDENVPDPYFDPPYERSFQLIREALIQLLTIFKSS